MASNKNIHKLAFASINIYSDELNPVFWTHYFGFTPDMSFKKGESFVNHKGNLIVGNINRPGAWIYSAKPHVDSDYLDPYIMFLISKFGLPRSDLPDLLVRMNTNMRCFCFWDNYSGDRVAQISPYLQDILAKSGIALEIDEYPGTNNGQPWPDVADDVIP